MDNNKKRLKGVAGGARRKRTNNNNGSFWAVDPTIPQLESKVAELEEELAELKREKVGCAAGNDAPTERVDLPRTPATACLQSALVSGADPFPNPGEELNRRKEGQSKRGGIRHRHIESPSPAKPVNDNVQHVEDMRREFTQRIDALEKQHKHELDLLSNEKVSEKIEMQQEVLKLNTQLQEQRNAHKSAQKKLGELEENLAEKHEQYSKLLREHGVLVENSTAKDKTMDQLMTSVREYEQESVGLRRSFAVLQDHIVSLLMECCIVPASYFTEDAKEGPLGHEDLCAPVQGIIGTLQEEAFKIEGHEVRSMRTRSHQGEDIYKGLALRQLEAMAYFQKQMVDRSRERDEAKADSTKKDAAIKKLNSDVNMAKSVDTENKEVKVAVITLLEHWILMLENSSSNSDCNAPVATLKRHFEKSATLLNATASPSNTAQILQDLCQAFAKDEELPLSWLRNRLEPTKKSRKSSSSVPSKQRVKKTSPTNGKRRRSSRIKLFPVSELERLEPISKKHSSSPRARKRLRKSTTNTSLSYAGRALQLLNHHEKPVLSINPDDDESTN